MDKLRIMSNNVWCCWNNQPWWEERGMDCSSESRSKGIARVYSELLPDMIGWQEGDYKFQRFVPIALGELGIPYTYVFVGGIIVPILYNKKKLVPLEARFMVYPESVPGYEGVFNNVNTKAFTAVAFRIIESGKMIVFANTHLWWRSGDPNDESYYPHSNEAREFQMNMMLDTVEELRIKYDCPAVVCGDLNDNYHSLAVQGAIKRGYLHAHDAAAEHADDRNGWHYCFPDGYDMYENPKPFEDGIDHILVKGGPEGFVRCFERYTPEYYMPLSDHFPTYIDVEF